MIWSALKGVVQRVNKDWDSMQPAVIQKKACVFSRGEKEVNKWAKNKTVNNGEAFLGQCSSSVSKNMKVVLQGI